MIKETSIPKLKPKVKKIRKPSVDSTPKFMPSFKPSFKKSKPSTETNPKPNFMPSFVPVNLEIMNKRHPRWKNFLELVHILLGYNGPCSSELTLAKFVLEREGVDVEKSIEYLQDNGGFCDCEILMNVA